jgi:hypothetical protein
MIEETAWAYSLRPSTSAPGADAGARFRLNPANSSTALLTNDAFLGLKRDEQPSGLVPGS